MVSSCFAHGLPPAPPLLRKLVVESNQSNGPGGGEGDGLQRGSHGTESRDRGSGEMFGDGRSRLELRVIFLDLKSYAYKIII